MLAGWCCSVLMKLWCVDQKSGSPALGGADDGDMVNDDDEIIIRGMLINSTIKKLIFEMSANKKRMNEQKKKRQTNKRTNEQICEQTKQSRRKQKRTIKTKRKHAPRALRVYIVWCSHAHTVSCLCHACCL